MIWLVDTLVWTGVLIGLVLVVRRAVARHFGARAAYALWALPLMRLVLPPLVLPAAMAPRSEPVTVTLPLELTHDEAVLAAARSHPVSTGWNWSAMLVALWLAGALAYVVLRLLAYRRLRSELLADARVVGAHDGIRLVETPATRSPLAFGLIDKVIALPPGFMAQTDRAARDLALAHELAHHRAHDLAANFAALPLFALHWFNPLSWIGWNAMRRDQEAACDARVVEGRARTERAFYATLIAGAAASPKAALAAPMACPVLGEKSIVHRLRNLTMTDHSIRRRRAGNFLVALAVLALPLTATRSYAQAEAPEAPVPPVPPEAPVPPESAVPPIPPEAPVAPEAPQVFVDRMIVREAPDGADAEKRRFVIVREGKGDRVLLDSDKKVRQFVIHDSEGKQIDPDSPEFRERMKVLEDKLGKLDAEIGTRFVIDEKRIERLAIEAGRSAEHAARFAPRAADFAHRFEFKCEKGEDSSETRTEDGKQVVRVCRSGFPGSALVRLRAARSTIAGNDEMSAETRREVLEKLDQEIARLEAKQ